jgi:hypothetical protein
VRGLARFIECNSAEFTRNLVDLDVDWLCREPRKYNKDVRFPCNVVAVCAFLARAVAANGDPWNRNSGTVSARHNNIAHVIGISA